jgi:uncharacterized circularly permuted ATP-grasp superfamily protein
MTTATNNPVREPLLDGLADVDLAALGAEVGARLDEDGVRFGGRPFRVCPVPRLLEAGEWDALAVGLRQRARALSAFVRDVYTEREIISAGVVPARVIDDAEGYEPDLQGRWPSAAPTVPIVGFDVVRDPAGRLLVLEDNARTPSGYTYAVAARRAVLRALHTNVTGADDGELPVPRPVGPDTVAALRAAVYGAAPAISDDGPPMTVVLTDGPGSPAHFEHATAARWLDAPLVTVRELQRHGSELWLRPGAQRPGRRIAVVYRRSDEDTLRGPDGAPTRAAELLLGPWLAGRLALVAGFGTGVADDKLAHAYVEDMIRFYLGEEPLVASVPTLDLGDRESLRTVLDDLPSYVIKPRHGHGGHGVVICSRAGRPVLRALERRLRRPGGGAGFVAQRVVALSQHPTVVDGELVERHVDLRPFAFLARDRVAVVPGGLTRVAFTDGSLVVNSSQDGGAKDTWVLP